MAEKQKTKILVVDDEKVVRDFLAHLLTLEGTIPRTVESGKQAIELMKSEFFDFVFLDVRMPEMDGVATLKELKKLSPQTKYVMMTGYSVDNLLEEAEKENILATIRKPFDIAQVIAFITEEAQQRKAFKVPIMVIDDDRSILEFFKRLLKDDFYEVSVFDSAPSALEKLKTQDFDLIFLDIFLGETNGLELYVKIREIKPKTQIIFITGDHRKIADDLKKLDVRGCLFKPFEIDQIFEEINKVKKN